MSEMIFGSPPPIEELMGVLLEIEDSINRLT